MERHNVLSTNIAHIDTPGFRPMDVARPSVNCSQAFGCQLSAAMTRTSNRHLPGGAAHGVMCGQLIESSDAVGGLDGNYVSLDLEATKVAENQLRYEAVTALTSAQLRTLSYVASDCRE
jgi:flagellar basal-body rod protein FlgB